jgi:rhodanese-related sulfurtransferase
MTIIDVRTPEEYQLGHLNDSINIPLKEIQNHIRKIESFAKPILLCCASGNRSQIATAFLKNKGIECENGGSWTKVQQTIKR